MDQAEKITINGRGIGPAFPPYICAEISANHNGSIGQRSSSSIRPVRPGPMR